MQVALLGAGRHAGRGPHALDVEHHRGHFGVIGQSQEFLHQRQPGAGSRGERARAVPGRADHHADRGQFVLGLDHDVVLAAAVRVDTHFVAEHLVGIHQRRRRRDRVPGADRGAGIHAAQRRGGVAVDDDVARGGIHLLDPQRQRAGEVLARVVVAELDRLHVGVQQLGLLRVGLGQQRADDFQVEVAQRCEHTGVADVLHQDARAHARKVVVAKARQRHADHGDVVALEQCRARPGGVVDEVAAGSQLRQVARIGLGVERDHDVGVAGTGAVPVAGDPDLVPGRQPLDVRREIILPHHRYAAPEDGLHQEPVGTGRAGAVDGGDLDDEVVYAVLSFGARHKAPPSAACGQ